MVKARPFLVMVLLAAMSWIGLGVPAGHAQVGVLASLEPTAVDLTAVSPSVEEPEVVRLINAERTRAGLWPLAVSPILARIAREHSEDMRANLFFSHEGSDRRNSAQRAADAGFLKYGWDGVYVGENIAAGYASAAAVFDGWMNSDGHRENILRPGYREVGVGLAVDPKCAKYCTYWTLDFGSEPKVLPIFIADGAGQVSYPVVNVTLTDETVSSWGSIGPVREVMLSSDPSFGDAEWQTYAQRAYFRLPPTDGAYTLHVRFRDAAGQEVRSSTGVALANAGDIKPRVFIPLVVR